MLHQAKDCKFKQGCALAAPGGLWRLTFALGRLENLYFLIQIIYWAPWILRFQSTRFPSIFLRAQPLFKCPLSQNEEPFQNKNLYIINKVVKPL